MIPSTKKLWTQVKKVEMELWDKIVSEMHWRCLMNYRDNPSLLSFFVRFLTK